MSQNKRKRNEVLTTNYASGSLGRFTSDSFALSNHRRFVNTNVNGTQDW